MNDLSNTNPIGEVKQIDDKIVRVYDKNGAHKFDLFGILYVHTETTVTIINPIKKEQNTYNIYGNCIKSLKL